MSDGVFATCGGMCFADAETVLFAHEDPTHLYAHASGTLLF